MTNLSASSPTLLLALNGLELTNHFASLLRGAGYGVLPVDGPEDAGRRITEGSVDLALLDVDWGADTIARLAECARRSERPCPVAVVVGWWDARTAEVAPQADLLIYKPPTQRQLLGSIRLLMDAPQRERLPA